MHKPNALSEAGFADWVFGFLKVELTIRNEHPSVVRVNWIHGGYVKETLACNLIVDVSTKGFVRGPPGTGRARTRRA